MSRRALSVLLVVFVVLAGAAAAPWWWPRVDGQQVEGAAGSSLGLSRFTAQNTTHITITRAGGSTTLSFTRRDGEWLVEGKPANAEEMKRLFAELRTVEVGEVVSRNRDNHTNFGVTRESGTLLELERDGDRQAWIIGNGADAIDTFYVRRDRAARVYRASGGLSSLLAQDEAAWREKQPAPSKPTKR